MFALAMLLTAAPHEEGLPFWLVGRWCPEPIIAQSAEPGLIPTVTVMGGYGPGPHCVTWQKSGWDTLRGEQSFGYSGRNDSFSRSVIEPGGRSGLALVTSRAYDRHSPFERTGLFFQISRTPSEIVFGDKDGQRIGYRRDGDVLIESYVLKADEAPLAVTYRLAGKGSLDHSRGVTTTSTDPL